MKLVGAVVMLRSRTMHRTLLCLMGVLLLGACAGGEVTTMPIAASTTTPTIGIPATPRPETPVLRVQTAVGSATAGVSTPSASAYPIGCTPAEVEAFLERFLAAFNEGDMSALRAFFPATATGQSVVDYSGEKFVWYSMTDNRLDGSKRHFVTFDLPTLWAYFAERHAHQERLRLATLRVGRQEATVANLEVKFYRTADDVPPDAGVPPGQAIGKAVMNCRDQTLLVMSLGQGGVATPTPTR
jgi:hypothetical protein